VIFCSLDDMLECRRGMIARNLQFTQGQDGRRKEGDGRETPASHESSSISTPIAVLTWTEAYPAIFAATRLEICLLNLTCAGAWLLYREKIH
jgi:hypothetical protein